MYYFTDLKNPMTTKQSFWAVLAHRFLTGDLKAAFSPWLVESKTDIQTLGGSEAGTGPGRSGLGLPGRIEAGVGGAAHPGPDHSFRPPASIGIRPGCLLEGTNALTFI